ncbi:hypothetical protein AV654_08175 [Paenibacillus elgii]|uniref:Fibronectin type-III domain-containing protein n=1 Tax=Paenibacillus elgii TaxID=189691 RepID=A0A165RIQ6_9BACL|nr:fibronectin type III domain-containing protein [Paenibacillus elgii]KZE82472.1 hypothetical protein AV654_08175 [Paenibacillus elgii]
MKKLAGLFLFFILTMFAASSAFAATVGSPLTKPEEGWQRFDDTAPQIVYSNYTNPRASQVGNYNGTASYSVDPKAEIEFRFTGPKIRIITQMYMGRDPLDKITIDGVSYTYTESSNNLIYQALVFEKTGLSSGVHTVKISRVAPTTGYLTLDAVDIDASGQLLGMILEPEQLQAKPENAKVTLTWGAVPNAKGYNVKRSTTPGGPYTTVAGNVYGTSYTDTAVTNGTTYYYVVTALHAAGESGNSNEASATPQAQESNRAILVVTLDNGLEKEFDLPLSEVQAFINWYEGKAAGTGSASYAIDKHDNNKGPFKSRKDYVIFDKILTYEVSEYTPASK